jgi:hypothetical protein
MDTEKKRGRTKGTTTTDKHPPEVISIEQAIEEGLPVPEEFEPKVAVKAGDLVFWIPERAKYRKFPGILTEQGKFLSQQTVAIPIGFGKENWMHLNVGEIIRQECLAQFYSAIAKDAKLKPPRKQPKRVVKRERERMCSKAGSTMSPKRAEHMKKMQEARRRNAAERRGEVYQPESESD